KSKIATENPQNYPKIATEKPITTMWTRGRDAEGRYGGEWKGWWASGTHQMHGIGFCHRGNKRITTLQWAMW
ncbi:MAG: hypothetical protein ACI31B_00035, partial [Muribaculaceae bacterium]